MTLTIPLRHWKPAWAGSPNLAKNFTAKDILQRKKKTVFTRKLVGFEMIDKGIPRSHYPIKDKAGNTIGMVTSGTQSPTLDKAIGLGYVDTAHAPVDNDIYIEVRNQLLKAKVVKVPFK